MVALGALDLPARELLVTLEVLAAERTREFELTHRPLGFAGFTPMLAHCPKPVEGQCAEVEAITLHLAV